MPRNVAQHGEKKGVDVSVIRGRIFKQEQSNGVASLGTQAGGPAVYLVIHLPGNPLDSFAGFRVDQWTVAQRPGNRGLRYAGPVGYIERCRLT